MKYAVNEEGIAALNNMSAAITSALEQMFNDTSAVLQVAEDYRECLGPHIKELNEACKDIFVALKQAAEPASETAEMLEEVADGYQDVIDTKRFSGKGGAGGPSGTSSGGGTGGAGNSGSGMGSVAGAVAAAAVVAGAVAVVKQMRDSLERAAGRVKGDFPTPCASKKDIVPLLETVQTFEDFGDNGTIYDHPFDADNKRICAQGSNSPDGRGDTCGLCACGTIINEAGGDASEYTVVGYAANHTPPLCDRGGRTVPQNWVDILGAAGIGAKCAYGASLEDLAEKVEQGHGVIIGVNMGTYLNNGDYEGCGHALVLESVIRDKTTKKITGYVVSDSNGKSKTTTARIVEPYILDQAYHEVWENVPNRPGLTPAVVTDEVIR